MPHRSCKQMTCSIYILVQVLICALREHQDEVILNLCKMLTFNYDNKFKNNK
jgi:hypothetical protein